MSTYIADDNEDGILIQCQQELEEEIKKYISTFFTPYKSVKEFCGDVINPVVSPIASPVVLTIAAVVCAAISVFFFIEALLFLAFTAGVFLFDQDLAETGAELTRIFLDFSFMTAVMSVYSAISMAVLWPLSIANLVTRSLTTIISPVIDLCSNSENNQLSHSCQL